jgi:hypothetical protein
VRNLLPQNQARQDSRAQPDRPAFWLEPVPPKGDSAFPASPSARHWEAAPALSSRLPCVERANAFPQALGKNVNF